MLYNKNEFVAEFVFWKLNFKKMIINLYFIGFGEFITFLFSMNILLFGNCNSEQYEFISYGSTFLFRLWEELMSVKRFDDARKHSEL